METKFKPFDKVLVRLCSIHPWRTELFGFYREGYEYAYVCMCNAYKYCIPYEGNEHLLGTTDDYVEPLKPKDGVFVTIRNESTPPLIGIERIMIFKSFGCGFYNTYAHIIERNNYREINYDKGICVECGFATDDGDVLVLSTEKEKQKLLDALHKEGKDWDAGKKEIVDYRWKPRLNEPYYIVRFSEDHFMVGRSCWDDMMIDNERYKKSRLFHTEEECQALCDKLNEAIKNVK